MASATAMVQPPPRPPPRPPSKTSAGPRPPPRRPPPPPKKRAPPSKPPPSKPPPSKPPPKSSAKRNAPSGSDVEPKRARKSTVSIRAPVVLRDVNVFQKKHQVGEGTYGSVFVGQDKVTNGIVALKRINTEQEENGFPITSIREAKILKALTHVNIVTLKEIVTSKDSGAVPKNVYMVFEYLEYDLTGMLGTPEIRFSQDHIKSWSQQLLNGVHYMHTNKVIHRDLKPSNLLINKRGELKIADWGLARSWNTEMKKLSNKVITLWYRPPELLLGCVEYSPKIDMWSVGCIVAEMFRRTGFLKGSTDVTQLDLIFRTCGHPSDEDWSEMSKTCRTEKFGRGPDEPRFPNRLEEALKSQLPNPKWMTDRALHLIVKMMELNPEKRWSAEDALDADYFFENPMAKPADKLSMNFAVTSCHEWECRKKYEKKVAQRKAQAASSGTAR